MSNIRPLVFTQNIQTKGRTKHNLFLIVEFKMPYHTEGELDSGFKIFQKIDKSNAGNVSKDQVIEYFEKSTGADLEKLIDQHFELDDAGTAKFNFPEFLYLSTLIGSDSDN
jgi:Ca2+-binding EF-hand superfamily protein